MVAGMVNITSSGFKNVFNKPITTATIIALKKLGTSTPGNK
jgi:hypothetical protein